MRIGEGLLKPRRSLQMLFGQISSETAYENNPGTEVGRHLEEREAGMQKGDNKRR